MKKLISFLTIAVIFTISCTREIPLQNYYNNTADVSSLIDGNFAITNFSNLNSYADSTSKFNGYVFSFGSDGKVIVVKDNQIFGGSYTESHVSGNNLELIFYFDNDPLNYLNGNWWIKSISDASIELGDASTGDVLEFSAQ